VLGTPAAPGRDLYAVKIHELATGTDRELATTPVSSQRTVEFSPSGQWLAVATETNSLKVFEVASGKELSRLTITGAFARAQFAPGDAILCTEDREGHGTFWDVRRSRSLGSFSGTSLWAPFSSNGQFLITGGNTNTARVWEAATGREVSVLKGHWGRIIDAAFFPDGQRVMTGSDDGTAKLWDMKTGRELLTLSHAAPAVSVAVAPDGKRILTAAGNTAMIWSAQGWETNAASVAR
jgi:WD40 repeat protein